MTSDPRESPTYDWSKDYPEINERDRFDLGRQYRKMKQNERMAARMRRESEAREARTFYIFLFSFLAAFAVGLALALQ